MQEKTVQVIVHGRVQGVWFRATTKDGAEKRGVHGWVRNTSKGTVEAMFQGPSSSVDEMISWCHKGSSLSKVEKVDVSPVEDAESFSTFRIRR